MTIHILRDRATPQQVAEMLIELKDYIKLAVDIERHVVAGGGEMHFDCEQVLLQDGSRQEDIWGADWIPASHGVRYDAIINIRPRQNNRSMRIQNAEIRDRVAAITRWIFEDVK